MCNHHACNTFASALRQCSQRSCIDASCPVGGATERTPGWFEVRIHTTDHRHVVCANCNAKTQGALRFYETADGTGLTAVLQLKDYDDLTALGYSVTALDGPAAQGGEGREEGAQRTPAPGPARGKRLNYTPLRRRVREVRTVHKRVAKRRANDAIGEDYDRYFQACDDDIADHLGYGARKRTKRGKRGKRGKEEKEIEDEEAEEEEEIKMVKKRRRLVKSRKLIEYSDDDDVQFIKITECKIYADPPTMCNICYDGSSRCQQEKNYIYCSTMPGDVNDEKAQMHSFGVACLAKYFKNNVLANPTKVICQCPSVDDCGRYINVDALAATVGIDVISAENLLIFATRVVNSAMAKDSDNHNPSKPLVCYKCKNVGIITLADQMEFAYARCQKHRDNVGDFGDVCNALTCTKNDCGRAHHENSTCEEVNMREKFELEHGEDFKEMMDDVVKIGGFVCPGCGKACMKDIKETLDKCQACEELGGNAVLDCSDCKHTEIDMDCNKVLFSLYLLIFISLLFLI